MQGRPKYWGEMKGKYTQILRRHQQRLCPMLKKIKVLRETDKRYTNIILKGSFRLRTLKNLTKLLFLSGDFENVTFVPF